MATTTVNGITLQYPNDPCLVFNPCLFFLSGTMSRTRVYISHGLQNYSATYQTPNGGVLDLREFMQSFFDGMQLGGDLERFDETLRASEIGKGVNITIFAVASNGTTIAQFNVSVFCVWGGTGVAEDYERTNVTGTRRITWFKNYPLTVGLYSSGMAMLDYTWYANSPEDGNTVRQLVIPSKGLYNINIDDDGQPTANHLLISDSGSPYTDHYIIDIDREHDEGVYLRWIDRQGYWRYWLFKKGDPTVTAASRFGMWNRNDWLNYDNYMGWQNDGGRRQSFTRNDVQPLCAPLVDSETFDMLQGIATSPCIDMFLGYGDQDDPMWTAVTVEAGSYTKDVDKPEQDFVFNLIMPEIPIQTL